MDKAKKFNISKDKYSKFIEVNREEICEDYKWLGVQVLARVLKGRFLDIKLCLEDGGEFIIARFRLSDLYFVGYAKGLETGLVETWYTLSEMKPPSSSASSSSSLGNKKKNKKKENEKGDEETFSRISIKDSTTEKWGEVYLNYSGGYTGANTMMAIAAGGGGNDSKAGILTTDLVLGQQTLKEAVHILLKHDPTDTKYYSACAKACVRIALTVAEPIRFEFLKTRIVREWGNKGYKLCPEGDFLIKNWVTLSSYVEAHKDRKLKEAILETENQELSDFLHNNGVKRGGQLKKIFGIVVKSSEAHADSSEVSEVLAMEAVRAPKKSTGKGKARN